MRAYGSDSPVNDELSTCACIRRLGAVILVHFEVMCSYDADISGNAVTAANFDNVAHDEVFCA